MDEVSQQKPIAENVTAIYASGRGSFPYKCSVSVNARRIRNVRLFTNYPLRYEIKITDPPPVCHPY